MGDQNSVKISELISKEPKYQLDENGNSILEERALLSSDIFIVEDEENTKNVTFENLIMSAIYDNEPGNYRLYSSAKVNSLIREVNEKISNISAINSTYDKIMKYYESTTQDMQNLEVEFNKKLEDKLDIKKATKQFQSKRDNNVLIKSSDLDTASDDVKIKLANLAKEVIDAMTGNTGITVSASAPTGGWLGDHIANSTITRNKLVDNYQFVQNVTEGDINLLIKDGFYFLGYKVEGLPKMSDDDDDPRIMRVDRISTDYITQTVYYTSNVNERPIYIRRGRLSTLYTTDFVEVHEISPSYRIGRDMLKEEFGNNGIIYDGNIFTYRSEGQYYAKDTVEGLPSQNDYLVTVKKHGDEYLYTAELISLDTCKVYHAKLYFLEGYVSKNTQWYIATDSDKSKFDKKQIMLFGDDAFYGLGCDTISTDSVEAILKNKYGMITNNRAIIGATISNHNEERLKEMSIPTQIEAAPLDNIEYAVILAGTRDWEVNTSNLGLNDINTKEDVNTFRGALVTSISKILTKNPNVKLLLCTPFYRGRFNTVGDGKDADTYMVNDKYLRDFVDVMIDVADYYHIPLLNLYSTSGINKFTESTYLVDGLLLNNNGHQLIADKIYNAMEFYF